MIWVFYAIQRKFYIVIGNRLNPLMNYWKNFTIHCLNTKHSKISKMLTKYIMKVKVKFIINIFWYFIDGRANISQGKIWYIVREERV